MAVGDLRLLYDIRLTSRRVLEHSHPRLTNPKVYYQPSLGFRLNSEYYSAAAGLECLTSLSYGKS